MMTMMMMIEIMTRMMTRMMTKIKMRLRQHSMIKQKKSKLEIILRLGFLVK